MGSFVPWLYYGFYCHYEHKLVYLSVVLVLGVSSIFVSLYDKFSEPNLRPLRAGTVNKCPNSDCIIFYNIFYRFFSGVFASFGLSGIIPAIHYGLMEGWFNKISQASLGWLILMGKKANAKFEPQPHSHTYTSQVCCTFSVQFFMLCECLRDGFLENSTYGYDFTSRRNQYTIYSFLSFILFSFYSFNHIKYFMFS